MEAEDRTKPKKLDEQLAPVVGCSNTMKVLTILAERPASPKEIGEALELSTSAASYHAKKLVKLGWVELVERREVGSTYQHFYRALVRPQINNEEWRKLSVEERQQFSIWIMQLVLTDAARSFAAALFDACPNNHLSRTPMTVDQQGFDEVAEIQDKALAEILRVEQLSAERMARGEKSSCRIVAAMTCFEIPRRDEGPDSGAADQGGPRAIPWEEGVKRLKIQEVPSTFPAVAVRKSN